MVRFLLWIRVFLSWQMAALYNRHSSYSARLAISLQLNHHRYKLRHSRALLLSLNAQHTSLTPDVRSRLGLLGIYGSNQACSLRKRKKRPYRAGCRHRGKTEETVRQKHPVTRCADKTCSCFPTSDSLLPITKVPHVCLAQLADRIDQLGISPGSHRCRTPARKRPYHGGRRKQGQTVPVIVNDRSYPRIFHPLCSPSHDTVRPLTDKCDTA